MKFCCSGLCVHCVRALGGGAGWLAVGPEALAPVTSWVQPPAQLNTGKRQPTLSQTSPPSLASLWGEGWGDHVKKVQSHLPLGQQHEWQGRSAPQGLPVAPVCCRPEQSDTGDGFHNWQRLQNLLQPLVNIDFSLRGFQPTINPSEWSVSLFVFPPPADLFIE